MKIDLPTTLPQKDNQRFRELWLTHFNEEITTEEANREAYKLLSFYALIIESMEEKRIKEEESILKDR